MRALFAAVALVALVVTAGCDWHPGREQPDCCAPDPSPPLPTYQANRFGMLTEPTTGPLPARELRAGDDLRALVRRPGALRDADPALGPVPPATRRFGFVLTGCMHDGARLAVDGRSLRASLLRDDPTVTVACGRAVYYYAVFDVPAHAVTDPVRFTR